ncbi:phosphatase PAP2 family protein [Candidatus Roizmanbacteria bacterium]|nr:phosphatase PAP2 family protein [Candidatus Roizmanbacteria bacterium]
MSFLLSLDYFLTNFLNRLIPHNTFFDYFFSFFSMKGGSILIWMAIIVLLIIFEEKINKKFILYFFVALGIMSIVVLGLKNTVRRARPTTVCEKDFSFPSAHAATAFAAATVLTFFDKKRRRFYYSVAVLIGYSRIYLGCHYFLDVISGVIIGYIISQLLLFVPDTFPFHRKS